MGRQLPEFARIPAPDLQLAHTLLCKSTPVGVAGSMAQAWAVLGMLLSLALGVAHAAVKLPAGAITGTGHTVGYGELKVGHQASC